MTATPPAPCSGIPRQGLDLNFTLTFTLPRRCRPAPEPEVRTMPVASDHRRFAGFRTGHRGEPGPRRLGPGHRRPPGRPPRGGRAGVAPARPPRSRPIAGDVTDAGHRAALVAAAERHGFAGLAGQQRQHARSQPAPPPRGLPARGAAPGLRSERRGAPGPVQVALPALRRSRGTVVSDLVGRRRRGLRGLGRLRIVQGRARPGPRGSWPPRSPSCASTGSTRATCAPPCTRPPSRARTSRTGPTRNRWCRPSAG